MSVKANKGISTFHILVFTAAISLAAMAEEDMGSVDSVSSPAGMSADSFPEESETPQDTSSQPRRVPRTKNPTRVKIDFEDQLINGKHNMPEAEFIFTRTQFNYKKMIKLRDSFVPEVKQGKDEFRGQN
jgi:hypothetical protein